ncbi:unnamed protein product [Paramecium octaurelia]|uniref:Tetratricopeptide repeat protein n=1 Tax=Paramecium octaurelia TaxID=43137 RepID=A0A8S1TPS6_PAROT|nr:unnamed protein product [Paramecium octaurelia]
MDDALKNFNKVIELNPKDAKLYKCRADLMEKMGQNQKAFNDYQQAIDLDPQFINAYFNRALLYQKQKKYQEALNDLNKIIELDPKNASTFNRRGCIYHELEKDKEAMIDFNTSLLLDPNNPSTYNNRGQFTVITLANLFSDQGLDQEALNDYNQSILLDPLSSFKYCNRGLLLKKQERNQEALNDFNKAIELDNKNEEAYNSRGNLYKELNKLDEAFKDYNKATELNPKYVNSLYNRGILYQNLGEKEKALKDYMLVLERNQAHSDTYNSRGNLYMNDGKMEQAIKDYNKAIEINPLNPLYLTNLGSLYYHQKDYIKAKNFFSLAQGCLEQIIDSKFKCRNLSSKNIIFIQSKLRLISEIDNQFQITKNNVAQFAKNNQINQQQEQAFLLEINKIQEQAASGMKPTNEQIDKNQQQQILDFLFKIEQEVKAIYDKLEKESKESKEKILQLESKVQKLEEQDSYQLEEELNLLKKPENFQSFLYYKSLFWRLYNYLHAMQLMSTNLFTINRDAMVESNSEKVADFLKTMSSTGSFIMGSVPIIGTTFNAINAALDYMVEKAKENKFQIRMQALTKIQQKFFVSPSEQEREIQFAAIALAKKQKPHNNDDCEQGALNPYIVKLSILESNYETNSESEYWKRGIQDSLRILRYLESNSDAILTQQDSKKFRIVIQDAIQPNKKQAMDEKKNNSHNTERVDSSCCQLI